MKLKSPLFLAALCLSRMACLSFAAEKVCTVPPAVYMKEIASLVTPLEMVLTHLPDPPKGADDGWVLLDESIYHVLSDGRRVLVEHQVYKALSDAGASNLGRSVRGFHTSRQKFSVVMARTIQPDGKKQNVQPDAMFLQTPQREADQSLYQDNSESVIVFPNVKPGSVTESITVIEDIKPRIPGQFTSYVGLSLGWHAHTMRCLVELPKDFAERLIISSLGSGVPEPQRETLKNGRVRIEWLRHDTPMMHGEPGRAPFTQTGPLARLTTLRDWSEMLRWYVPLTKRQANLGANLESLVDEWTKDAKSPREVLAILTAKVSDDVRYVGLEFGDSDLEPHAAASVWEQQYGDCKDKASLLCAMLVRKGITAHMALLNTRHLGRIERRSPDYRDFDHVIVRAELPDGAVFCDPTISGAPPGTLPPDDSDRDLLLVKEPEQWVHTPPQEPGRVAVNFNAKFAATGELSGWVTLEAEGYFGTAYGDLEAKGTRQQLLQRLSKRVDSLYPGARVVDVKTVPRDRNGTYRVEAYFVVPPSGALTLAYPFDATYLPETGDGEVRETDLYLWRNQLETSSVIALPTGYHAVLPQPLKVSSPFCEIDARWENSDAGQGRLQAASQSLACARW